MSLADLKRAFKRIDANEHEADFVGSRDEALVALAERTLGLRFPPTWRAFLARYGCGSIAGEEFYGLVDDDFVNSSVPDAIWLTLDQRRTTGLPETLVIVYGVGDGTYYALDCGARGKDGECPVVEWFSADRTPPGSLKVVASDFGALLRTLVDEAL